MPICRLIQKLIIDQFQSVEFKDREEFHSNWKNVSITEAREPWKSAVLFENESDNTLQWMCDNRPALHRQLPSAWKQEVAAGINGTFFSDPTQQVRGFLLLFKHSLSLVENLIMLIYCHFSSYLCSAALLLLGEFNFVCSKICFCHAPSRQTSAIKNLNSSSGLSQEKSQPVVISFFRNRYESWPYWKYHTVHTFHHIQSRKSIESDVTCDRRENFLRSLNVKCVSLGHMIREFRTCAQTMHFTLFLFCHTHSL